MVLAAEDWIAKHRREAVYVDGLAWSSSLPWYEGGSVERVGYASDSFRVASDRAGMRGDPSRFDLLEIDDTYSYKLLQHVNSLFSNRHEARHLLEDAANSLNPSGGALGVGNLIEASALHRVLECVLQLRGEAGAIQVRNASSALVLSWRGIPTATGGVAILSG